MRRTILFAGILLAALGTGAAMADDHCSLPMADWQPREAVQKMAQARGWTVSRIKADDGCYEIRARDGNGRDVKAKVDPGSLAVIDMEYGEDDGESGGGQAPAPAATTAAPPQNGLFGNGAPPKVEVK